MKIPGLSFSLKRAVGISVIILTTNEIQNFKVVPQTEYFTTKCSIE